MFKKFRIISILMILIAICFIVFAINHPELGGPIYIGNLKLNSDIWGILYGVYFCTTITLFVLSFEKDNNSEQR